MMSTKINIGLVDDHTLFRRGIKALLKEYNDLSILFDVGNGKELQNILVKYPTVDVILMDIKMPILNGFATTEWVKKTSPATQVLALTMFDEQEEVIKMINAGASGYLLKESSTAELYQAIKSVYAQGFYSNELTNGNRVTNTSNTKISIQQFFGITPKEMEFLALCSTELTYKEIAATMKVAPRTVDNYRQSLFEKLEIKNRIGLAMFAVKHQIAKIK